MSKSVRGLSILGVTLFLSAPLYAYASMMEVFSIFEAILPMAILWAIFVSVWYICVAVVATRHGAAIGGVPPLPKAIWILMWIGLLSVIMIGPMGIIYLLLFFPVVTIQAFRNSKKTKINEPLAVALRRISVVGLFLLSGLIVGSTYIHNQRSKADFQRLSKPFKASVITPRTATIANLNLKKQGPVKVIQLSEITSLLMTG
jgi:hypothetical protein